jgi:hypothetical protein
VPLDDVDIGILAFLSDMPDSTTTEISKALFKPPYNIRKLDSFIRYRMKRFVEEQLVFANKKERKYHYSINEERVIFGDGILRMNGQGDIDIGYFVVLKTLTGQTIAVSIDDYEQRVGAKKIFSEQ